MTAEYATRVDRTNPRAQHLRFALAERHHLALSFPQCIELVTLEDAPSGGTDANGPAGVGHLKARAKHLRHALVDLHSADLSHTQCLELVAREDGHKCWNVAKAQADVAAQGNAPAPAQPAPPDSSRDPHAEALTQVAYLAASRATLESQAQALALSQWGRNASVLKSAIEDVCTETGEPLPDDWACVDLAFLERFWPQREQFSSSLQAKLNALMDTVAGLKAVIGKQEESFESAEALLARYRVDTQLGYLAMTLKHTR
ncbi:glyoxalase superfamily protein [Vreelandella rituensis]|uniref:Glyoxalase-related protein domain-containing protein n=1 Tax=Vreelandella rituensis TaxID=2282306 RepID=A0A368UD56_9GAMM|nr:glyoxalase superfamily protein [Halomonas rituensis]RCV93633.1 hypothetical protein DU506_00315 [Halomonas rituensis]